MSSPRSFIFPPSAQSAAPEQHPNSPTNSHFPIHISATHAGGIQPPASFFRPSKPTYQPQYSRPSTSSSHQQDHVDVYPLAPHSDDNHPNTAESIGGGPDSATEDQHQFASLKRIKQSREPLLPVSSNDTRSGNPTNSRPSLMRERSISATNPTKSATRIVRNSFDKVLSIGHGISFDSIRRSASMRTPPTHSVEGRPTFESKLSDDDELEAGGNTYGYPLSSKDYNHSTIQQFHNFTGGQPPSARNSALLSVASPSPEPEPSFIPTPPNRNPPLSAVPVINPKTGKYVRRYELHPSRNRFFLGGRLLTGGDSPWAFIASFTLVLTIAGVWFGTTAVWWWKNASPAVAALGAYFSLLTISTMLATVRHALLFIN